MSEKQTVKNKKNRLLKIVRGNYGIILSIIVLVIILAGYFIYGEYKKNNPDVSYKIVQLEKHDLAKTISIDGQVFSDYEIDLASEIPGIVSKVYVQEGDEIKKGQLLMKLKDTDYRSQVNSAYVNEQINKVALEKIKENNQDLEEDITVNKNNLKQDIKIIESNNQIIQDNINKLRSNILSDIKEIDVYLDQVLRLDIDDYFDHVDTDPVFTYRIKSKIVEKKLENYRKKIGVAYQNYQNLENKKISDTLIVIELFETLVSDLRTTSVDFLGFSDSELEIKEKNLFNLRNELAAKKNILVNYQSQLDQLIEQLTINNNNKIKIQNNIDKKDSDLLEDIKLAEKKVRLAQVQKNNAYLQLQKTNIRATRTGLVVDILKDEGEYAGPSVPLIKVISKKKYLKALIPEVDIEKISLGMTVNVKLDSVPNKQITGIIDFIYPDAKDINGLVYYETKISLKDVKTDILILPGMSAEIFITYENKKDVLALERGVAKKEDNKYFVQILNPNKKKLIDKKFVKKYFKSGFVGDNFVEVLDENLKDFSIVNFIK